MVELSYICEEGGVEKIRYFSRMRFFLFINSHKTIAVFQKICYTMHRFHRNWYNFFP